MHPENDRFAIFPHSEQDAADIERWFADESPELTPLQERARSNIRVTARVLAMTIQRNLPRCKDRSVAIRQLREAILTALAAVENERGAYVDKELGKG